MYGKILAFSKMAVSFSEVKKHNSKDSAWMVLGDEVYDLTEFAHDHPGGAAYIHDVAGTDATDEFLEAHPLDIIDRTITGQKLKQAMKGKIKPDTLPPKTNKPKKVQAAVAPLTGKPPLEATINIFDFEKIARTEMLNSGKKEGWDYYSSGGDDEITLRENHNAYHRIWLKPRVMVNVKEVDTSREVLGHQCEMPVFLSAVAMCGLGHADGEVPQLTIMFFTAVNTTLSNTAAFHSVADVTGRMDESCREGWHCVHAADPCFAFIRGDHWCQVGRTTAVLPIVCQPRPKGGLHCSCSDIERSSAQMNTLCER